VPGALEQAQATAARFGAFEMEAGDIEVFPRTGVIYIGLNRGGDELRVLHEALHTGAWDFAEPFEYCPHITLAQDFDPDLTGRLAALARQRWQAYPGPRAFRAETLTFVQNTTGNSWLDLATFRLRTPVPTR
jgi:2'-5' RNA ligase